MGTLLKLTDAAPAGVGANFENSKYAMDTVLAQFNVTRDIPQAGELTAAKGGSSTGIIIAVIVIIIAAGGAGYYFFTKKKKAN